MRAEVQICIRESWEHRLSPFCAGSLGRARSATERGRAGGVGEGAVERVGGLHNHVSDTTAISNLLLKYYVNQFLLIVFFGSKAYYTS